MSQKYELPEPTAEEMVQFHKRLNDGHSWLKWRQSERYIATLLQSLADAGIEIKDGKVLEGQTRDDGIEAAVQKILWCSRIAGDENAIRFHNSVVNECYQAVNSMLSVPPTDSRTQPSQE